MGRLETSVVFGAMVVVARPGSVEEVDHEYLDRHGDKMYGGYRCRYFQNRVVGRPSKKMSAGGVPMDVVVALRPGIAGGDGVVPCAHDGCCYCRWCGAVGCIPHCRQDHCFLTHYQLDHRIYCCCFRNIGFRNLVRFPEAFLLVTRKEPRYFGGKGCIHMGFEGRSDHCFGTAAFHRVQHPEADLESRIGSPVAEDQHGCCSLGVVGDIDGARRRMDFGSRYGDRNTLAEEVHRNRMPRFANVAVVAAVAAIVLRGSLLTPTKAVVGVAFAHPVDLRDIWRNKDPVVPAVLVVRRDLSWKMVHHLHLHREVAVDEVGSAYPRDACWNSLLRWQKIHGFQPPRWDCGRI